MAESELVAIETFYTRMDAEMAHGALAAHGIDSFISPDDAGGGYAGMRSLAIRLMVRADDAEEAREVLAGDPAFDPEE